MIPPRWIWDGAVLLETHYAFAAPPRRVFPSSFNRSYFGLFLFWTVHILDRSYFGPFLLWTVLTYFRSFLGNITCLRLFIYFLTMHVAIFPGLMSTFFDWENLPSLSKRLASFELWGSFWDPFFFLSDTSVGKLSMLSDSVWILSSSPSHRCFFLLAGLVLFWACPQFSACLGNQTFIPFWFRIRSGTCGRRGSVSSPSWLWLVFMCVHSFPIGSEV